MAKKRFPYAAYAAKVAAYTLTTATLDISDCPNLPAANRAMHRLIQRLASKGQAIPPKEEWPQFDFMAGESTT